MKNVIGVSVDDSIEWHAVNGVAGPDANTLCGLDADDPSLGHYGTVPAPRGQKITCQQCYNVWKGVTGMRLREASFDVPA